MNNEESKIILSQRTESGRFYGSESDNELKFSIKPPKGVSPDFFERKRPLMLEELYNDDSDFKQNCIIYFNETGYGSIFTMSEQEITLEMIRKTIDTIYS